MKFINTLECYIRQSSENWEYSSIREILNTELREHRRLMEEGTITRKQYSRAKSRILGRHR
jgi:ethanolamine utilization protein EutA (predicted chaperonin)